MKIYAVGGIDPHGLFEGDLHRQTSRGWETGSGRVRLALLRRHPHHVGVLKLAADNAGTEIATGTGVDGSKRARGEAVGESFGSDMPSSTRWCATRCFTRANNAMTRRSSSSSPSLVPTAGGIGSSSRWRWKCVVATPLEVVNPRGTFVTADPSGSAVLPLLASLLNPIEHLCGLRHQQGHAQTRQNDLLQLFPRHAELE